MKLRALEYSDLLFVHELNNEYSIMSYWFEEPYESLTELQYLFDKHLLDESERRFIVEDDNKKAVHIYESQGFKTEGLLKEQFYTKGKYKDAYFMSLLKSEYIL